MGVGIFTKLGSQWCPVKGIWTKQGGVWCPVKKVYVKVGGQWCLCFPPGGYDVILAWNPISSPPNCEGYPTGPFDYWLTGIIPHTKIYKDGGLEGGVWFSMPAGGSDGSSWTLMFDSLDDGRLLVATGKHVYKEIVKESDEYEIVATVGNDTDPSFLLFSPDKQKIAFGLGYTQPLLILDGSDFSTLATYDVNYYSAAWRDNQYLFIDGGVWPTPPYQSGVAMIDTISGVVTGIVSNIPGSSSGICFDRYGNFFCGIGYNGDNPSLTGKIYYFTNNQIENAMNGSPLDFNDGHYLCQSLSAGHMLITPNDELVVGGGDFIGTTGHIGYAEVFKLTYDESGLISVASSQQLILDPCQNDTAAGSLCLWREG